MSHASPEPGLPVGLAGLPYRVSQISLAVRDLHTTMDRYHRLFGWAPWQVFDHVLPVHHATELRGVPVHYALRGAEVYVGALNFELLQPLEGPNLWTELIDRRGEGIASIATMFLERADGDAVKAAFRDALGIPVSMRAEIGDHIEYYYLDTEARFGCLIESGSGHAVFVDGAPEHGGRNLGMRPMEMVLAGAAACTAFDVVLILKRARQPVTDCVVEAEADRAAVEPKVFTRIRLAYTIAGRGLDPRQVERAVKLSKEKYCSATIMLAKTAEIETTIAIVEGDRVPLASEGGAAAAAASS